MRVKFQFSGSRRVFYSQKTRREPQAMSLSLLEIG